MVRRAVLAIAALIAVVVTTAAQQPPARPMSPPGSTQAQVLGRWVKGDRPSFAVGQERYVGGKWLEITYGRPALRGRDVFGSGANYGKALIDLPLGDFGPPPVWRAGANVSTRLNTEATLTFGDKKVPPGEYSLFIDLKPNNWTLIVSSWAAQQNYNPNNHNALWGSYEYTPAKDVARAPMTIATLPVAIDQLTWNFADMSDAGGKLALMWDRTLATTAFTIP